MKFPVIDAAVSDRLINALCYTLMHSLWQGILLAAVAGLIVIGTRKLSSAFRYNLLISALLFFAAGTLTTFIIQFNAGEDRAGLLNPTNLSDPLSQLPERHRTLPVPQPLTETTFTHFTNGLSEYLKNHHNTIALIWFLII